MKSVVCPVATKVSALRGRGSMWEAFDEWRDCARREATSLKYSSSCFRHISYPGSEEPVPAWSGINLYPVYIQSAFNSAGVPRRSSESEGGCSIVVMHQLPKLARRVRFPSPAP